LGGFAVCAAIIARDRDGRGQKISLNLLDTTVALLANYVTPYFKTTIPVRPVGGGHPQLVPYQVFAASDGDLVVACVSDRFWPPLCRAIARADLAERTDLRTNGDRVRNRGPLIEDLARTFSVRPRAEWLILLRQHDVPCSPVNSFEQVFEDPQVRHNRMLLELIHPVFGPYKVVNDPIHMSRTPANPRGHAPRLGEHTAEVLSELDRLNTADED
jgi:crotonobetainyl-CoA:carnitine CoA-transferase CaiB-like acyl-CoA transferase